MLVIYKTKQARHWLANFHGLETLIACKILTFSNQRGEGVDRACAVRVHAIAKTCDRLVLVVDKIGFRHSGRVLCVVNCGSL